MARPAQQIINEIEDRFQKLCGPQWKAVVQSRGMKKSPQLWQEMHKRAKDALRGAMKNGKKRDEEWTILDRWKKRCPISRSSVSVARMDDRMGDVSGLFSQKLTYHTKRRPPNETGMNVILM